MSIDKAAERWRQLSEQQRREKLRTALHHLRTYAEAKRDIRRWRYGRQERRVADSRDIRL